MKQYLITFSGQTGYIGRLIASMVAIDHDSLCELERDLAEEHLQSCVVTGLYPLDLAPAQPAPVQQGTGRGSALKTYLISGQKVYSDNRQRPFRDTTQVEGHMTLSRIKGLEHALRCLYGCEHSEAAIKAVEISQYQLLDPQPTPAPAVHLNECSVIMPPVDSPILIEIAPGVLLRASRPAHAEQRNDLLLFDLETGGMFIGRPRWTHP